MSSLKQSQHPTEGVSDFVRIQTETGWGKTLAQFADWCSPQPGWRILDVGCGPGLLPAIFQKSGCLAYGIDVDLKTLIRGRLHPALICSAAGQMPFSGGCFDLVTASNLLFLLDDPLPVLTEIARLTSPDGRVCVLNPSERLSVAAAAQFAGQRGLDGLARASLINRASLAESRGPWTAELAEQWFAAADLQVSANDLKVGSGFARYTCGIHRGRSTAQAG